MLTYPSDYTGARQLGTGGLPRQGAGWCGVRPCVPLLRAAGGFGQNRRVEPTIHHNVALPPLHAIHSVTSSPHSRQQRVHVFLPIVDPALACPVCLALPCPGLPCLAQPCPALAWPARPFDPRRCPPFTRPLSSRRAGLVTCVPSAAPIRALSWQPTCPSVSPPAAAPLVRPATPSGVAGPQRVVGAGAPRAGPAPGAAALPGGWETGNGEQQRDGRVSAKRSGGQTRGGLGGLGMTAIKGGAAPSLPAPVSRLSPTHA